MDRKWKTFQYPDFQIRIWVQQPSKVRWLSDNGQGPTQRLLGSDSIRSNAANVQQIVLEKIRGHIRHQHLFIQCLRPPVNVSILSQASSLDLFSPLRPCSPASFKTLDSRQKTTSTFALPIINARSIVGDPPFQHTIRGGTFGTA